MIASLAAGLALAATPALARPYLMLSADPKGFQALDLGDITHQGLASAEVTLIDAPLAGAPFADNKLAALVKRRMAVDCQAPRWRVLSASYTDSHEAVLASDPSPRDWQAYDAGDLVAPVVQDAACLNRYAQQMVSRYLNIGEIFANYQRAWGKAAPEPLTEAQLQAQRFKYNH
jgi:hypothetical protein